MELHSVLKILIEELLFLADLNSPLLLETRSGSQYLAELSSTTMWTVLVVLPLLVQIRHSQFPVKPGWMFRMVNALIGGGKKTNRETSEMFADLPDHPT